MFKRSIAILSAAVIALGMAGCGETGESTLSDELNKNDSGHYSVEPGIIESDNGANESSGIDSESINNSIDGSYLAFDQIVSTRRELFDGTADELLEKARIDYDNIASLNVVRGETVKGEGSIITFENGAFTYSYGSGLSSVYFRDDFSGKYNIEDGKIRFIYDKYTQSAYTFGEHGELWNSTDKTVSFDAPGVDEYKIGADDNNGYGKALEKMNETGTYSNHIGPNRFYDVTGDPGMYTTWASFPIATGSIYTGNKKNIFECYAFDNRTDINIEILEKHGDFICTETAGWVLTGNYTPNNSFTVEFVPMSIFEDWFFKMDSETKNKKVSDIQDQLGINISDKTKIEFSDGKWSWLRPDGSIISQGTYSESTEHEGFIVIRASGNVVEIEGAGNEYIYIANGKIYYPYWIKIC